MAKKKIRRKAKKATKKVIRKKKVIQKKKKAAPKTKAVSTAKAQAKEKILGMVDHFFGNISVAAIKVKSPIRVGDVIHVKGHTTDFTQKIDSMQIEHQNVMKAKKGDDIGIKVKDKVRQHDMVYLAAGPRGITAQAAKPAVSQQPMFPSASFGPPKPQAQPPAGRPAPKPEKGSGPYSSKKFFQF